MFTKILGDLKKYKCGILVRHSQTAFPRHSSLILDDIGAEKNQRREKDKLGKKDRKGDKRNIVGVLRPLMNLHFIKRQWEPNKGI